jgi:cell division protein FtsB
MDDCLRELAALRTEMRELKEAHMALKDEFRKLRCDTEQDTPPDKPAEQPTSDPDHNLNTTMGQTQDPPTQQRL